VFYLLMFELDNLRRDDAERFDQGECMLTDKFRLDERVALITGAGKGIGRGIALAFAEMGADLILTSRTEEELTVLQSECEALGASVMTFTADITDEHALHDLIGSVSQRFRCIDILINNAGAPGKGYGPLAKIDRARFAHTVELNLTSAYTLTHLALPLLQASRGATIVNVSSALAWMVDQNFAAYGAAKAGVNQMTKILAYELAPKIRVNAIAPGAVETPSTAFIVHNDAMREATTRWIPLRRMGQPEDIALAALYLASDASAFVSGKVLEVDGGMAALPGSAIEANLAE
jgi:7-alpha-hydroxysteroid dehydrogenase